MTDGWNKTNVFLRQNIINLVKEDLNKKLSFKYLYYNYDVSPYLENSKSISSFNNLKLYRGSYYISNAIKSDESITVTSNVKNLIEKDVLENSVTAQTACVPYITNKKGNVVLDVRNEFRHLIRYGDKSTTGNHLVLPINKTKNLDKIKIIFNVKGVCSLGGLFYIPNNPKDYRFLHKKVRFAWIDYKEQLKRMWGDRLKEKKLYGDNIYCILLDKYPTYQENDCIYLVNSHTEGFDQAYFSVDLLGKKYDLLPKNAQRLVHDYGGVNNLFYTGVGSYRTNSECDYTVFFDYVLEFNDEKEIEELVNNGLKLTFKPLSTSYRDSCDFQILWDVKIKTIGYTEGDSLYDVQHSLCLIDDK